MNIFQLIPFADLNFAKRPGWAALAFLGLLTFSLMSAMPATASGSGFHFAQWRVTLSFPNDQLLSELTTEIWYKPANSPAYLVHAETEPLVCSVSGNLPISNEMAQFDGQSYIACDQPDMVQKIAAVSQGVLNNVPYRVPVRNGWVDGQIFLAVTAPANVVLPTHHHPSLQHGLMGKGSSGVRQLFRVDGAYSVSNSEAQVAPYQRRADFQLQSNNSYQAHFTTNGIISPGNPALIGPGLMVDLNATTIYFGYSPDSQSYFQGWIKSLIVDPGAFGVG